MLRLVLIAKQMLGVRSELEKEDDNVAATGVICQLNGSPDAGLQRARRVNTFAQQPVDTLKKGAGQARFPEQAPALIRQVR